MTAKPSKPLPYGSFYGVKRRSTVIVISFKDFLHNYDGFLLLFSKSVKLELKKCSFFKICSELKLIGIVIFRFIMAKLEYGWQF